MLLFETDRTIVRRFCTEDADDFFSLNGNEAVVRFIRPAKNRTECDDFLQENINLYYNGSVIGRYAVHDKQLKEFIGTFSFLYFSGDADYHIGYALLPAKWGMGYATELVKEGTRFFFQTTDKPLLYAITNPSNIGSRTVLVKAGFLLSGRVQEQDKTLDLFHITREQAHSLQSLNK